IRPPKNDIAAPHPLEVYFSAAKPAEIPIAHKVKTPAKQQPNQARTLTSLKPKTFTVQPVQAVLHADPPKTIDSLLESAKNIAHDDARKFEQRALAQEKRNLNTPAAALAQELRQPQKEIRLANGMLKIITAAGAVCFQPPPAFARDQPGLYGIPSTCP
ncbi:MAG: hypothetical protein WC216_04240, partial [Gallionella sp.]